MIKKKLIFTTILALAISMPVFAAESGKTLEYKNGWPRLVMPDGKVKMPLILFHSTEGKWWPNTAPKQVKMTAKHGIHLYSFVLHAPLEYSLATKDRKENFAKWVEPRLKPFKLDPEGYWMPRIHLSRPNLPRWSKWEKKHPGNIVQFPNGKKFGLPSIASEAWFKQASRSLKTLIDYMEKNYSKNVFGYHVDFWGETCYWGYRTGIDVSPVMLKAFRKWLKKRYGKASILRKAWNNPVVSFSNAKPGPNGPYYADVDSDESFVDPAKYRDHLDYVEFFNGMVAKRVNQFAEVVKKATKGRKLTVSFYGYIMQVAAPLTGHWGLPNVMRNKAVDAMSAPMAYNWRQPSGAMPAVCPMDSFNLWGKLWFNEDDENTYLRVGPKREKLGSFQFPDLKSILQSHKRNFGFLLTHGLGTWWMDLWGDGALTHPEIWKQIGEFNKAYKKVQEKYPRTGYKPDVAIMIDTKSSYYLGSRLGQRMNLPLLNGLRDSLYRLGASNGIYLLDDLLNDRFPEAKAYIFVNAFYMDKKIRSAVEAHIKNKNKLAIWIWAPPIFSEKGEDLKQAKDITGIKFKLDKNGKVIANIVISAKRFAPQLKEYPTDRFGSALYLSPKRWTTPVVYVEPDKNTDALGYYWLNFINDKYSSIKRPAFVSRKDPVIGNTNVFIGTSDIPATILRGILREAGIHLWGDREDIIHVGPGIVSVTATKSGVRRISFPQKVKVARELLTGKVFGRNIDSIILDMKSGDTKIIEMEK